MNNKKVKHTNGWVISLTGLAMQIPLRSIIRDKI